MNHKGTKRIETENLILRKFELSDADAIYKNWGCDSEVTKFLTWGPMKDVDISKTVVKSWVEEYKKNYILEDTKHYENRDVFFIRGTCIFPAKMHQSSFNITYINDYKG